MNDYSIALYLHIIGAAGLFVALGLEWTGLSQIRSVMAFEQVRPWMGILNKVRKVGFVSMLTAVITGLYMMLAYWGDPAWLLVTIGSLVLLIALAQVVTAPRMAVIGKAAFTEKGPVSQNFHGLVNNALLWISLQTRVAIALGIVFLKIAKPNLIGSLLVVGIAIFLGIASAVYVPWHERHKQPLPNNLI